jgi:hypothetical protein
MKSTDNNNNNNKRQCKVFLLRFAQPFITMIVFVAALIAIGIMGEKTFTPWGPGQSNCYCSSTDFISVKLQGSFALCRIRALSSTEEQNTVHFSGDYNSVRLDGGKAQLQTSYQQRLDAKTLSFEELLFGYHNGSDNFNVPFQAEDCGIKPDTYNGKLGKNNGIDTGALRLPMYPETYGYWCKRSLQSGIFRNIVIYNATTPDPSNPWNQHLRYEINSKYVVGVSTITSESDKTNSKLDTLFAAYQECLNWFDDRIMGNYCTCALDVVSSAVAISSLILLALLPVRVAVGWFNHQRGGNHDALAVDGDI